MRWIHTADWHPHSMGTVGGKLVIDPTTGLSITLTDFQKSLNFLFNTLVDEDIDLLLVAGDVFDSNKPTMDELRVVMDFFECCSDSAVQVVVIPGNHDIAQSSHLATALEPVSFLGVHVIQKPSSLFLDFVADHSGVKGKKVRIDCLPYPSRGRLAANMQDRKTCTPEELTSHINHGLQSILMGFQLETKDADYTILLAHGSVETAVVGEQPRTLAHDVFLPTRDVEQHYDYIALGHIHQTQNIGGNGMYCGSLLRQGFGEEKEQKGFLVCTTTPSGVFTNHVQNPYARVYRTLTVKELAELDGLPLYGTAPLEKEVVFRIKDIIPEAAVPHIMPLIQRFTQALPFVQVDVEVQHEDRTRDNQLSNQMNSHEALERCLERDGITDPSLSICRQLHLELCEEVSR